MMMLFPKDSQFYAIVKVQSRSYRGYLCYAEYEYQLAADMGGMGFIHSAECQIIHNSALINIHTIDAAARMGVPRYFFSSSVCVCQRH